MGGIAGFRKELGFLGYDGGARVGDASVRLLSLFRGTCRRVALHLLVIHERPSGVCCGNQTEEEQKRCGKHGDRT